MLVGLFGNFLYFLLVVDKADLERRFFSRQGFYQFVGTLLRLKNVPATFQRVMDAIMSFIKWKYSFVNRENIVIFYKTPECHLKHDKISALSFQKRQYYAQVEEVCFFHQSHILVRSCN